MKYKKLLNYTTKPGLTSRELCPTKKKKKEKLKSQSSKPARYVCDFNYVKSLVIALIFKARINLGTPVCLLLSSFSNTLTFSKTSM